MAEDSPLLPGASHHNVSHPEELTLVFKSMFPGSHCCILPADAEEEDGNIARNQSMVQEGWTGKIAKDGVTLEATCCHGVLSVPLQDSAFVKLPSSTITTPPPPPRTETTTMMTETTTAGLQTVFKTLEEFTITSNNKLGDLSVLGREYNISFELLLTAVPNPATQYSILHFTIWGNAEAYGDSTPALYAYGNTRFNLCSAIDGNKRHCFTLHAHLDIWTSIELSQVSNGSEIVFSMKVDGATRAYKVNSDARSFNNVKMYAGSPWNQAAIGKIRKLIVKTKE